MRVIAGGLAAGSNPPREATMRITDALHRAARALRATLDRFRRRRVAWMAAGLALAACDRPSQRLELTPPIVAPAPAVAARVLPAPPPPEAPIGRFQMTFYFIIHEAEMGSARRQRQHRGRATTPRSALGSVGAPLAAPAPATPTLIPLNDQACAPLAHVTPAFAAQVVHAGHRPASGRSAGQCRVAVQVRATSASTSSPRIARPGAPAAAGARWCRTARSPSIPRS
jgi:hypothetical protein